MIKWLNFHNNLVPSLTIALFYVVLSNNVCLAEDYGKGVAAAIKGDFLAAQKEWEPLAKKGEASPQFQLGWLYQNGFGVKKNYITASIWYSRAAKQGYAFAQTALADMYITGKGVPKNKVLAYMWLSIAAQLWDPRAKNKLILIEKKMSKKQISLAENLARQCLSHGFHKCGSP